MDTLLIVVASYRLVSSWSVPCDRSTTWRHLHGLLDSDDPMSWWPAVRTVSWETGRLQMQARSGLGYRLSVVLTDLRLDEPDTMHFTASGDLQGAGHVRFLDRHDSTELSIDWHVDLDRPWMRRTSVILRPIFTVAHTLVMRQGERRFAAWVSRPSAATT